MARIPDDQISRLKQEISLQRLAEGMEERGQVLHCDKSMELLLKPSRVHSMHRLHGD